MVKSEVMAAETDEIEFDTLMESIGNDGHFQKRFNMIFNLALVAFMSMTYMNFIFALSVPDHHCHVPGRNQSQYTLAQWQARMLPTERNAETHMDGPSSCKMFKTDYYGDPTNETQSCTSGWDYDPTWYTSTATSEQNWVCDHEIYVTNAYAATRIGEIVGDIVLGQLGDSIGRKTVFYIAVILLVVARSLMVIAAGSYEWFIVLGGLSSAAGVTVFQTPLLIGLEVSSEKVRGHLAFLQCMGWTLGICMLPFFTWWIGDWKIMILATTLPCLVNLALYRLMPESPRWLATRGNIQGAMRVLDYIAKVNGRKLPDNSLQAVQNIAKRRETTYGIASLFHNVRLARNTVLLSFCWMASGLTYFCLVLNATNMAGNPFLNFFLQSLVELPGYIVAQYLCNRLGRRWSHVGSYMLAAVLSIIAIITHGTAGWLATLLVCGMKVCQTITYYAVLLQSMEIYPTCIRQTGTSIGGLGMNVASALGPYIIYWGETIDARFMMGVLFLVAVLAAFCSAPLPETLNKKLPETLDESRTFGATDVFWSFNKADVK